MHHGDSIALWIGEKEKNKNKNNLNAVYHIQNNRHAHKRKNSSQRNISLRSELVRKQKASTVPVLKASEIKVLTIYHSKSNGIVDISAMKALGIIFSSKSIENKHCIKHTDRIRHPISAIEGFSVCVAD